MISLSKSVALLSRLLLPHSHLVGAVVFHCPSSSKVYLSLDMQSIGLTYEYSQTVAAFIFTVLFRRLLQKKSALR